MSDHEVAAHREDPRDARRPPAQCISLLLDLEGKSWVPVPHLSPQMRRPDLLRTCDRYRLVRFRQRVPVDDDQTYLVTRLIYEKTPGVSYADYFHVIEFNFVDRTDRNLEIALQRSREEFGLDFQLCVQVSDAGLLELSEWRLRQSEISSGAAANEICLAEAAMRFDVRKSEWTKAAKLPPNAPGHLATRRVGRNRFVTVEHARRFARDYHARRELRMLGTESGRMTRALPKRIQWRQQDEEDNRDRN